jgi:hypothetical protein
MCCMFFRPSRDCLVFCDLLLTNVLTLVTYASSRSYVRIIPFLEGPFARVLSEGNGCGSRVRIYNPRPGGLGIASAGMMTGLRGAPLDWDSTWRLTAAGGASQETRPGLSHGIHLRGKCRGGAPKGERARSADGRRRPFAWRAPGPQGTAKSVRAFRRFASLHYFGARSWDGLFLHRGVDDSHAKPHRENDAGLRDARRERP